MEEIEELNGSRKKKVIVSLATLGAIAASGEGVRRRRQADSSSEWARKALVIVALLALLGALGTVGARRRRAGSVEPSVDGAGTDSGEGMVERIAPAGTTGASR